MSRTIAIAAALFALGLSAVAVPSAVALTWSAPDQVAALTGYGTTSVAAVDASGVSTVVWPRYEGGKQVLVAARRSSGSWGTPQVISDPTRDSSAPAIVVDASGVVTVMWREIRSLGNNAATASRFENGTWSTPVPVSSTQQYVDYADLSVDTSGVVTAVWMEYNGASYSAVGSRFAGASWSAPVVIAAGGMYPQVASGPSGSAVAVWHVGSANYAARFAAGAWGPASALPDVNSGSGSTVAQIVVDSNGIATAEWSRYGGPSKLVLASRLVSGSWDGPTTVGSDVKQDATIAVDAAGTVTLAWASTISGQDQAVVSRLTGAGWSTPTPVSTGTGNINATPSVAAYGTGGATVAWVRSSPSPITSAVVQAASFESGAWGAPVALSEAGTLNASAVVAAPAATGPPQTFWLRCSSLYMGCNVSGIWGSYATPPIPAPDAPAQPTAVAGNAQATVTVAPGAGSGGPPASYSVMSVEDNSKTCTVTVPATTCDVTGLVNGTAYTFTATATNVGGTSGVSAASSAVTPTAVAAAPVSSPTSESASGGTAAAQPLSAAPAPGTATLGTAPALVMRAPAQRDGQVVTTGRVPDGATRVVQVAHTGAAALSRVAGFGMNTRVITKCLITTRRSKRVFACRARLSAGTWVIITQARNDAGVVASRSHRVVVQAMRRTAVTG